MDNAYKSVQKDESDDPSLIELVDKIKQIPVPRNVCCAFSGANNNICSRELCDNGKHSVFVATSESNYEFGKFLKEGLTNQYNVELWKENDAEAGLLFCDKVCDKIYGNMSLVAEISDYKPNVFFEAGFGLGLGRIVFFAKMEGTQQHDNQFLKALYYSEYKLISDMVTNIEKTLRDEKIGDKSLRDVKLKSSIFGDLSKFNKDKNYNKGILLLGAENNSLSENKKYFENNGIGNINPINIGSYASRLTDIVKDILEYKIIVGIVPNFEEGKLNINLMNACKIYMLLGLAVTQNLDVRILSSKIISNCQGLTYQKQEDLGVYLREKLL